MAHNPTVSIEYNPYHQGKPSCPYTQSLEIDHPRPHYYPIYKFILGGDWGMNDLFAVLTR